MDEKQVLALLSASAPEVEGWAYVEFLTKFLEDYPSPWQPTYNDECFLAGQACRYAKDPYYHHDYYMTSFTSKRHIDHIHHEFIAWQKWQEECFEEFKRDEWPLMWAKKRLEQAMRPDIRLR